MIGSVAEVPLGISFEVVFGDEVDQPLHRAEQSGIQVAPRLDASKNLLPRGGDVGLRGMRPAQGLSLIHI